MGTETKLKNPGGDRHEEFDRDINLKGVLYIGVGLAALTVLSFVVAWFIFGGLASYEERRDPEPSPLREAAREARPAGTTLQATPERDLEELLAIEHERLEGYGLAGDGEHARVPIERAMEMALERGLGTPEGEAAAEELDVPAGSVEGVAVEEDPVAATESTDEERAEGIDEETSPEGPDGP